MEQKDTAQSVIETSSQLALALSKAQAKIKAPLKNRHVDFTDKNGRRVKYSYADLADVISAVQGPLSENELAITGQLLYMHELFGLRTTLMHSSGQFLDTFYPLPDPLKQSIRPQEFGSALTYARRYSLSTIVGIASEEDDDGAIAAETPKPQPKPIENRSQQPKSYPQSGGGKSYPPGPEADLDDYLNNPLPPAEDISTIELLRNELYSLVETMVIPDQTVKDVINRYAPGKNSKQLNEKQLDSVINHLKLLK